MANINSFICFIHSIQNLKAHLFYALFLITLPFLQIKEKIANVLKVFKLVVLGQKCLNLLTKWYIVVNCGSFFYIFVLHHLINFAWRQ